MNKIIVYVGQKSPDTWMDVALSGKLFNVFHEVYDWPEGTDEAPNVLKLNGELHATIDEQNEIRFSKIKNMVIGGIYKIPVESDEEGKSTWSFGHAIRIGHWPEKEKIAAWRTRDFSEKLTADKEKALSKKDKMDYLLEFMKPLLEEYSRMRGNSRIAFELRVLAALRRGL